MAQLLHTTTNGYLLEQKLPTPVQEYDVEEE